MSGIPQHTISSRPRNVGGLLLLAPFFLLFALFFLVPLAEGIRMSLFDHTMTETGPFVGLDNYKIVLQDPRFAKAAKNAIFYLIGVLIAVIPLAVIIAHLLAASWSRLRPLLAFGLLAPGLTPPAVLAILFTLVFYGRYGMLNRIILMPMGFDTIQWLKDPQWILTALIIQCAWRWTGIVAFFVLAGLDAVPVSQREAARLEGAGPIASAWHVSIPFLRPVILFCALYLAVDALSLFAGSWLLLGGSGGTSDAGLLLVSYVHQQAFVFGKFGVAAAAALTIAPALLSLLAILVWRFSGGRKA